MKGFIPLACLSLWLSISVSRQQAPADIVLFNGKVFTADSAKPSAEAIAIRGEQILAVGSNDEIKRMANAKTRLIDLQGRTVIPGINDAHFHFAPDPRGSHLQFKSLEPGWTETLEAIKRADQETSPGLWIFGDIGFNVLSDNSADRFALDRVASTHPVLLRAYYGHGYIVNSKAMALLHIDEEGPDPMGGYYERVGDTKRINGRFWEYADWNQNRILASQVSDDQAIEELKKMAREAIRFGITSMQIMPSMPIDRFARLSVKADLPIRVRAISYPMTSAKGRDLSEYQRLNRLKLRGRKVKVSGIKWILDGTPFERGGALRETYKDRADWRGRLNFPESEILKMMDESLALKQQMLFHCAGDRCVEAVLDALEKAGRGMIDWREKRVRIEHGDGVSGDLIERAKRLGVIVVQNPTHFSLVDMIYARYSPNTKFFMARSLIEAGVPFALGSDGPMNPFLNIMLATVHPVRPGEGVTREQAVYAYTAGSAYAEFAEKEKGILTKGHLADLTVLSQDIFTAPVTELPMTQSLLTFVGGKIVYEAPGFK
jgi:predicted amidohydrolase YtcJ